METLYTGNTNIPNGQTSEPYVITNLDGKTKTVNGQQNELREASCLFYYNFDFAAVQRYCGGRYTSHQQRRSECFEAIKQILQPETFWNFVAGEIDGVPNCLDGTTTYDQFQQYEKEANRKSIQGHEELVQK
jgi:hypothetical protein